VRDQSTRNGPTNPVSADAMDDKIVYHEEMERIANLAGDFTKAEHHGKMQEIYKAMKDNM
jgi:hypothetical protein